MIGQRGRVDHPMWLLLLALLHVNFLQCLVVWVLVRVVVVGWMILLMVVEL